MPRVGLFGGVTISFGDVLVSSQLGHRASELFAHLMLYHGVAHRREKLAELVWPDAIDQRSRSSLNTTIWRINCFLKTTGLKEHILLDSVASAAVKLVCSPEVYVDCHSLQENVRASEVAVRDRGGLTEDERLALRADLDQYAGAFLEGYDNEWVVRERERLHCLYIRGQTLLMHDLAREGRYEEALECGRAILTSDEMREVVQREVMWLYVMNGQRGEAIIQYRKFRACLKRELGIEPMSETSALYQHILNDEDRITGAAPSGDLAASDVAAIRSFLRDRERSRALTYSALVRRDPHEV